MAFPHTVARLVGFSTNFNSKLSVNYAVYQMTLEQAGAYTALHESFIAAQTAVVAARDKGQRDKSLTNARDEAMTNLLSLGRSYYAAIQKNPAVSDAAKLDLGVVVIDRSPQPEPAPREAPLVRIAGVTGRTLDVVLSTGGKESKPANAKYSAVYTFVGENYSENPGDWAYHGSSGKNERQITLPTGTPAGAQVWVMAAWLNNRLQAGPASVPVATNIQGGGVNSPQATMRLAA